MVEEWYSYKILYQTPIQKLTFEKVGEESNIFGGKWRMLTDPWQFACVDIKNGDIYTIINIQGSREDFTEILGNVYNIKMITEKVQNIQASRLKTITSGANCAQ